MKMIKKILVSFLVATACITNAFAQENQSYFLHTVEKGQSLYSISSMYGVSQADIVKLNPGSDEKIYIGRELRIPRTEANTQKETCHTIQAGETLYGLGVKYNVPATEISKANPGLSAQNFRIDRFPGVFKGEHPGKANIPAHIHQLPRLKVNKLRYGHIK